MKFLIASIMTVFALTAVAAEPAKKDAKPATAVQNDNCVKKDKNGKCPPLPDSPKPTPKKKAEEKK